MIRHEGKGEICFGWEIWGGEGEGEGEGEEGEGGASHLGVHVTVV